MEANCKFNASSFLGSFVFPLRENTPSAKEVQCKEVLPTINLCGGFWGSSYSVAYSMLHCASESSKEESASLLRDLVGSFLHIGPDDYKNKSMETNMERL